MMSETQDHTETGTVREVDASGLQAALSKPGRAVLVDFWSTTCRPCKAFAPLFERSAQANPDVDHVTVDAGEHPELVETYGVHGIPTLLGFADGRQTYAHTGVLAPSRLAEVVAQLRLQAA